MGYCGKSFLCGLVYIDHLKLMLLSSFLTAFIKETPEPFPLPTDDPVVKAAAGWAHIVSVTGDILFASLSELSVTLQLIQNVICRNLLNLFSFFLLQTIRKIMETYGYNIFIFLYRKE